MSKFNARSVEIDGHRFDSAAEGRRYATLAALERAGKIAGLELQPRFDCVVAGVKICSYVADFRYRRDGARGRRGRQGRAHGGLPPEAQARRGLPPGPRHHRDSRRRSGQTTPPVAPDHPGGGGLGRHPPAGGDK